MDSTVLITSKFMTNSNKNMSTDGCIYFNKTNLRVTLRSFVKTKNGVSYYKALEPLVWVSFNIRFPIVFRPDFNW
jgi:hypothetical protein